MNDLENNSMIIVKVKKLYEDSKIPAYAHIRKTVDGFIPEDACLDLFCHHIELDRKETNFIIHTGISVEYGSNKVFMLFPRSSLTKTNFVMQNSPGIIDLGYRGEILIKFKPINKAYSDYNNLKALHSDEHIIDKLIPFHKGDAVGQFTIINNNIIIINESLILSDSLRGKGGYGSTNEKK